MSASSGEIAAAGPPPHERRKLTLWWPVAAIGVAVLVFFASQTLTLASLRTELDRTLLLTSRAVAAEVDRFRALPDVAAQDACIRAALDGTGPLEDANDYLQAVAALAGADQLYLIDASGNTIAASNWDRPGSFVGENYAFRPYFREAIETGHGRFYAIGVTTGVPGYFLSTRIYADGVRGVLVVKIDLRPLQEIWRAAEAEVALADGNGVVFLSSRPDWQYRPLTRLSAETLAEIDTTRTYDGVAFGLAEPLVSDRLNGSDAAGKGWIARIAPMSETGWQVIASRPTDGLQILAFGWAALAALVTLAIAAAVKTWEQRRQIIALRLSEQDRLEMMVIARTTDLAREVDARRQAEVDLRATQEALIHTEKMAALGRMSAAIVHEISQPLAAMEATLAAAEIGVDHGDAATVTRLGKARALIRRMQRTTKHLKSFARKEVVELSLIDMRDPVAAALDLVAPRLRGKGVIPTWQSPDQGVFVMAGAVRVEQVAVNLLLNALDAVADCDDAHIAITLTADNETALLEVRDKGVGIAEADLSQVGEPFVSTKLTGEGLGLGLAICRAIVADFNGSLDIASTEGRGTLVTVSLPLAAREVAAAE